MPSFAPAGSREAVTLNRERGHVMLRESMPSVVEDEGADVRLCELRFSIYAAEGGTRRRVLVA
jgi:hypothetical protein